MAGSLNYEKEFQRKSADYIYKRLFELKGDGYKRFLLADEVGLGKTIIAKLVIEKLFKNSRSGNVLYICSNAEIADQNIEKLVANKEDAIKGSRLTLLKLDLPKNRNKLVISLTPGTSINISNTTGRKDERKFIYFLLNKLCHFKPRHRKLLIEYLRCNAGVDDWEGPEWEQKEKEYQRKVNRKFKRLLRKAWNQAFENIPFNSDEQEHGLKYGLKGRILYLAKTYTKKHQKQKREIIGRLRLELAKVTLEELSPRFVILDEFQRFKDMIDVLLGDSIAKKLLENKSIAALLLSATPYKMYTMNFESQNHYEDFGSTLSFLYGENSGKQVEYLRSLFEKHKDGLKRLVEKGADTIKTIDPELRNLTITIEEELKKVMLRTERRMFIEDCNETIKEHGTECSDAITKDELEEFLFFAQAIEGKGMSRHALLEYWKSGQFLLNFMDADDYQFIRKFKELKIHKRLFSQARNKGLVFSRNYIDKKHPLKLNNLKLKKLFEHIDQTIKTDKALWIPPRYNYYQDHRNGSKTSQNISKYLIFSSWKFVPKLISMVYSYQSEASFKRQGGGSYYDKNARKPVLQLRISKNKLSSYSLFNIFYPSISLAKIVDLIDISKENGDVLTYKELVVRAGQRIRKAMQDCGVKIVSKPKERYSLFEYMLFLDVKIHNKIEFRSLFKDEKIKKAVTRNNSSESIYGKYTNEILHKLRYMPEEIYISENDIEYLAKIAISSPAICLLRTIGGLFLNGKIEDAKEDELTQCLMASVVTLRNYFNKYWVRDIIDSRIKNARSGFYWEQILDYCAINHLQEVLDEYGYLLKQSLVLKKNKERKIDKAEEIEAFLRDLDTALGINVGIPTYYSGGKTKRGNSIRCHFAMSFGDQSTEGEGGVLRKSQVREAFNSPFWPFILSTTSVGQEGLDFHRYCNKVVHWNLPSNPVDLEQREGRVNRFNSIAIRSNIAKDNALSIILNKLDGQNLWQCIFDYMEKSSRIENILKQGIAPCWIYECSGSKEKINRYVFIHNFSKDKQKYEKLKKHLMYYRLAFGQPRQEDMVNYLSEKVKKDSSLLGYLPIYTVNLSPDFHKDVEKRAREFAVKHNNDKNKVKQLLKEVRVLLKKARTYHADIEHHYEDVINLLEEWCECNFPLARKNRINLIMALIYFLDPFDECCDYYRQGAFEDDVKFVEDVKERIKSANK